MQVDQEECGSWVTRSIIDDLPSLDIQLGQTEGESGVTRSIIDELNSSDIQGDQMESDSGVTRSIIDELHSSVSKEIKWKVKVLLLEGSFMSFILRRS